MIKLNNNFHMPLTNKNAIMVYGFHNALTNYSWFSFFVWFILAFDFEMICILKSIYNTPMTKLQKKTS